MRTVHWMFVVSVALFVSGIGFIIAGARTARLAGPPVDEAPVVTPVASIKQIMNGIMDPAVGVVYDAVSTAVTVDGVEEVVPESDEAWDGVASSAAALVESGNLLLLGGRALDDGDWVTMTRAFMDASTAAMEAAEAHDPDGILEAGADIYTTCENCHEKYQRQ